MQHQWTETRSFFFLTDSMSIKCVKLHIINMGIIKTRDYVLASRVSIGGYSVPDQKIN